MSRVALVTGASRNIGRAIAVELSQRGHTIACFGRDASALAETASIITQGGGKASVHVGDVSKDSDIHAFVSQAHSLHGRIDVIVNNAGVMREASVADTTEAQFRAVIDTNLTAAFVLAKAAYVHMCAAGGVIVNIGSMFGALGVSNAASYCASKAGIEGITRALAAEWARDKIRVVCVAPGYVKSDISSAVLEDPVMGKRILSRIALRRAGEPEEIARLVSFLASEDAGFITGETFVVDGGQRMMV